MEPCACRCSIFGFGRTEKNDFCWLVGYPTAVLYRLYHLYHCSGKGPLGWHPPRGPFQNWWYKWYKWYARGMLTAGCAPSVGLAPCPSAACCRLQVASLLLTLPLYMCSVPSCTIHAVVCASLLHAAGYAPYANLASAPRAARCSRQLQAAHLVLASPPRCRANAGAAFWQGALWLLWPKWLSTAG